MFFLQFRQWGREIRGKEARSRGERSAGLGDGKGKVTPRVFFLFEQG